MARYDGGWGRFDRPEYGRGGPTWGDRQRSGQWLPDADFGESGGGMLYGPGRYGLGPYHERLRKRRKSDKDLKEEVQDALFYDTWVDAESITVEVKDGVVTLRGELPDFTEIRYATDDAWDVDGVVGVRTELTVGQPRDGS